MLGNGDSSVERDHRRGPDCQQCVIERDDQFPIRFFGAGRVGVNRGNRGLNVIFGQLRSGSREIEQALSFCGQFPVPPRAVLFEERVQVS